MTEKIFPVIVVIFRRIKENLDVSKNELTSPHCPEDT